LKGERKLHPILETLRGQLIVSCQAEGDDPFNRPEFISLFAKAAAMGGAAGIRALGKENISAIAKATSLPVVGLTKGRFDDGTVLITGDFPDVSEVLEAGAAIVALDATARRRPNGLLGDGFVKAVKQRFDVPVLADIGELEEARLAVDAGADAVATTLSGYTPRTAQRQTTEPDWDLLEAMVRTLDAPVIVEGGVWTPGHARRALEMGAHAVVVGTAITRPRVITSTFVTQMRKARKEP